MQETFKGGKAAKLDRYKYYNLQKFTQKKKKEKKAHYIPWDTVMSVDSSSVCSSYSTEWE